MIHISKTICNVLLGNTIIQSSGIRHTYDITLTLSLEGTHYCWPHYYFCSTKSKISVGVTNITSHECIYFLFLKEALFLNQI